MELPQGEEEVLPNDFYNHQVHGNYLFEVIQQSRDDLNNMTQMPTGSRPYSNDIILGSTPIK